MGGDQEHQKTGDSVPVPPDWRLLVPEQMAPEDHLSHPKLVAERLGGSSSGNIVLYAIHMIPPRAKEELSSCRGVAHPTGLPMAPFWSRASAAAVQTVQQAH